jgi:branched-chain amino acid transport system permease protein
MEKAITFLKSVPALLTRGYAPYFIILAHILIGSNWVYADPRSTIAFLFLLTSLLGIYYFQVKPLFKALAIAILLLGIMPILGLRNIFYLEVIFQISVFAALALGLNIVVGFAGLLNLGYAAFYAVGAYLWGFFGSQQMFLLNETPGTAPVGTPFFLPPDYFYLFLILGAIVAALVGILLGLPVLRVRGDYLAIVTLGFGEVIRVLANNLDKPLNFTNGPQGITPIQRPSLAPEFVQGFNELFSGIIGNTISSGQLYNVLFYMLSLVIVGIIIVVARNLEDSKMGRAWTAIREDETAAIAMGIPLVKMKLSAFAVGASFAGTMGVLVAASRTFVSPESFSFMQSIGVLVMVILGGIGSIPGVIVGAAVVTILNLQVLQGLSLYLSQLRQSDAVIPLIDFAWRDLSTQLDPAKYQRLLFGMILVIMMIFRPAGLIPAERRQRDEIAEEKAKTE